MAKGKPVLGRGLASLISRQPTAAADSGGGAKQDDGSTLQITANIDLARIQRNPYQPRADFEPVALDELKRSIQTKGVIQPITVRRAEDGYQLISGERRVRAAREAGLKQIPAYIIRVRSEEEMLELALVENLQREQLNPIEVAISYKRLIDDCKYTQEEVSQKIGKDRTTIANFLRLLKLPETIQLSVRKGELSGGHARALVAVEDEKTQMDLFRRIIKRGLSVRDVERFVRAREHPKRRASRVTLTAVASSLSSIEDKLRQSLGTKVQVRALRGGKGEIIIEYYSSEDLDRLLDLFAEVQARSR